MTTIPHINKQSGAALIVGLVLLGILTLLTATSMNSSTMSLRMADNVRQSDLAFQAAESALLESLSGGGPLMLDGSEVVDDEVRPPVIYTYTVASQGSTYTINPEVKTTFEDKLSPGIGEGLDASPGSGVVHLHFEMQSQADTGRGGKSEQRMGFYVIAPTN